MHVENSNGLEIWNIEGVVWLLAEVLISVLRLAAYDRFVCVMWRTN
jgi:hypothetical protein